jgi:acyl-CoA dehydrogenase
MSALPLRLESPELPPAADALRAEVRAFVDEYRATGLIKRPDRIGIGFSPPVSQALGKKGWIGMTWPACYGGGERSALERYIVTEELLAAGVPVGAHWVADRQSGPVMLRFGNEAQRLEYLPRIARGECYFCIGMSEPNSGSDLASLRSRGDQVDGGWKLNGRKVWTTNAHRAHYMIALVRTAPAGERRQGGLSQFIVDLKAPGVTVRPIISMVGEQDFNEVILDDVLVSADALIGVAGNGWSQVSAELAYERSGPERWLSTFRLLVELLAALGPRASDYARMEIGRLMSHLMSVRQLSLSVASMLEKGETPGTEAAIVKDLGTRLEQEIVRVVRNIVTTDEVTENGGATLLHALLTSAQRYSPAFTIRGGSGEILRGIVARGLGLR